MAWIRPIFRGGAFSLLLAAGLSVGQEPHCAAIEMFTYFGDGSRIGLPNLEVPVEAYPGIPLRSDRIRARRRSMRGIPVRTGQPIQPGGMTIRAMPELPAPIPPQAGSATPADAKVTPPRRPAQP